MISRIRLGFIISLIFTSLFPVIPSVTVKAASDITPLKYYAENNYRYFVGFYYYDMWKDTSGVWTGEGKQPNRGMHGEASFTYKFQFPGRKIKDVQASIYRQSDVTNKYFEGSRNDNYDEYRRSVSTGTQNSDIKPYQKQGIGTDTTTIPMTVNILLDAIAPLDIKDISCPNCAPEVEAYRIYVPILFKIELSTQLTVKHYTTTGKSLDSIFPPRVNEEMTVGKNYSFPPPANAKYQYAGFKKSTTNDLPSGSITPGNPYPFTYDGSFEKFTLFMYYNETGGNPCTNEPCEPIPEAECTTPVPGQTITGSMMEPAASGMIRADTRDSEKFNVLQGIPTSESLYGNVLAREYLFQDKFVQMKGKCTFKVQVTKQYTLKWDPGKPSVGENGKPVTEPDPQEETEDRTYKYRIERPYSYWTIANLEVYAIHQVELMNYALPNGSITIRPAGYTPPHYAAATNGKYYPPSPPSEVQAPGQVIPGGKSKPSIPNDQGSLKGEAERVVGKVQVENDSLTFNSQTIMSNQRMDETGPAPGQIPAPQQIGGDVLYSAGHIISSSKVNKRDTISTGTIFYDVMSGNIQGGDNKTFSIPGINTVTVHTPVVNDSSVTDDCGHNQKTVPSKNRSAFILDRPFTIRVPTSGQHLNIQGYGHRDYAKYFRTKQVWFPFDVYNESRTQLYPKHTWIDIPIHQLDTTFFLPVWVDEGNYDVLFRSIAENAPSNFTTQSLANTDLANHVATDVEPVEVIGRIYDFHITDIADYNWEPVFRKQQGSAVPTGNSYWVGLRDIDGNGRGNRAPFTLPIRLGSHPQTGMKNIAVKTGYHFKFDLKTKGNMFGSGDGIRITPTFYYVSADGTKRQEVDLYYHSAGKYFVRIGSAEDKEKRFVVLNERLRNVPIDSLRDTASYYYDAGSSNGGTTLSRDAFIAQYIKQTEKPTWVGNWTWMILPEQLRIFIGNTGIPGNASVTANRAFAAEQQWYGEYSLPAAAYVVPKGTNLAEYGRTHTLNEKSPIFLKNGFIIVNFNMETIRNKDVDHPHLQYIHAPAMNAFPYQNQWGLEGFERVIQDAYRHTFQLKDGDVIFYHVNKSSYDDFKSSGTH